MDVGMAHPVGGGERKLPAIQLSGCNRIVCWQAPAHRAGVDRRSDDCDPGPKADRDLGESLADRPVAHDGYVNIHSLSHGGLEGMSEWR